LIKVPEPTKALKEWTIANYSIGPTFYGFELLSISGAVTGTLLIFWLLGLLVLLLKSLSIE